MTLLEYLQDPDTPFGLWDLFYMVVLLAGFVRGLFKGFSGELASTLGTLLIFLGGWWFYRPVSMFIAEHTRLENEAGAMALAYVLMVFLFLASWKLLTFLLRKLFSWTFPDQIERIGGCILGLFKNALIICIVLITIYLTGHEYLNEHMIERSGFGRLTQEHVPGLMNQWFPGLIPEPPEAADGP